MSNQTDKVFNIFCVTMDGHVLPSLKKYRWTGISHGTEINVMGHDDTNMENDFPFYR
jgi:hypothetical protein